VKQQMAQARKTAAAMFAPSAPDEDREPGLLRGLKNGLNLPQFRSMFSR